MFPRRLLGLVSFTILAISSCHSSSPDSEQNAISKRLMLTFEGNTRSVACVVYSADGKRIASCYEEKPGSTDSEDSRVAPSGRPKKFDVHREVTIWDALTGKEQLSVNKGNLTLAVAFYPDGRSLAGSVSNMVKVWDTTTGKGKLLLKGHTEVVKDLDISRNGKWLATASLDGTVKVWDALTGDCLHTMKGHPQGVLHVSFSPDGKRVAGTGGDRDRKGEIRIWDWKTEEQVLSFPHDFLIGKALFSPDGKHIACYRGETSKYTRPGLVEVWEASSGKLLFRRDSHSEELTCIAYSPDGKLLATGSEDGSVIIRNSVKGDEILKLITYRDRATPFNLITSVAFSPQGDRLATASWDGSVKIWDIKDVKADKSQE